MTEPHPTYSLDLAESAIQHTITEALRYRGFLVLRPNNGRSRDNVPFIRWSCDGAWQSSGVADILAIGPDGKAWAIEVKRPGNHPSDAQNEFLQAWIAHGGMGLVASSVETVLEAIEG